MTNTDVGKHAWFATVETANRLTRSTTRNIVATIQVNRKNTTRIGGRKTVTTITRTRRITVVVYRSRPPLLPPAPAPGMRFGAAQNPGGSPNTQHPVTFRAGMDSSTTVLLVTTFLVSEDTRVPAASLSNNAAQIASVKNPRAPKPSADYSHVVVRAAGTSALGVVHPSEVIVFDVENTRFQRQSPRS